MEKHKKNKSIRSAKIFSGITISIFLIHWLIFFVWKNTESILLAFKHYDIVTGEQVFYSKGIFTNFIEVFRDLFKGSELGKYFLNGACFHLISLASLPVSLMVSFSIYKKYPAHGLFKVILFLPSIISSMVVVLIFRMVMREGFLGVWTEILGNPRKDFPAPLVNEKYAFKVLLVYQFFMSIPGSLLINIGTMSRIPTDLVEYGKLEGISLIREFWMITLPLMYSVLTIHMLGMFTGFFTAVGPLYAIYGNGTSSSMLMPDNVKTFGFHMMTLALSGANGADARLFYGYTAANSLIIGLISIPIVYGTKILLDKFDPEAEF